MGDPRKPRKKYELPKKQWDRERIERERKLIAEYGLKNHRELWRMQTLLRRMRREARELLSAKGESVSLRKKQLLERAKRYFIPKDTITVDDVLNMDVRSVLDRRLQSLVYKRRLGKTPRQARQFVIHGHIALNGERVSTPSYLVSFKDEEKLGWYDEAIATETMPTPAPAAAAEAKGPAPKARPAPAAAGAKPAEPQAEAAPQVAGSEKKE